MKQHIHIESVSYGKGFALHILQVNAEGDATATATPAVFRSIEPGSAWTEPTTVLKKDACQHLMDQLWYLGFRPEAGEMSVGQVAAVNAHLLDMQALAFAQLRVPKP